MIDLFHLAANDQSVYFLGRIFGVVGDVIPASNFVNDPNGPPPLILDAMFKVLNGVALTVGVLIVTYTTIVGLFATAAEGEFLGKKWSGLWVPIRTVIGIAGLFPSSGGYCAIQVILMWMVIQGVSAADLVWTRALEMINTYGNPVSGVNTPNNSTYEDKFQQIFIALVCEETAKLQYPDIPIKWGKPGGAENFSYYCGNNPNKDFCKGSSSQTLNRTSFNQYNFGPSDNPESGGACGTLYYSNANSECQNASDPNNISYLRCLSSRAQNDILPNIMGLLRPVAKQFADVDHQFIQFYESTPAVFPAQNSFIGKFCMNSQSASPSGLGLADITQCCTDKECQAYEKFFQSNPDVYGDLSQGTALLNVGSTSDNVTYMIYQQYGVTGYSSNLIPTVAAQYVDSVITKPLEQYSAIKPKDQWIEDATKQGWLMAGGYFMRIAKTKKTEETASEPRLDPPSVTEVQAPMDKTHRNNLISAAALAKNISNQNKPPSPAAAFTPTGVSKTQSMEGYDKIQSIVGRFMGNLTTRSTDPIVSIAQSGYEMMASAQALFALLTVSLAAITAFSSLSSAVIFGNGVPAGPGQAFWLTILKFLGPLIILLITTLFTVGAMLGVYVPLIPYIIFTVTSVGWFIGVIEAMVAAPFVALGIMSPSGQHELMSKAEPSIMILFNLFLRPTLMIFGMIAAMLLSWSIVRVINAAFEQVMYQIISAPGLIEQIVFMVAYTILIVTVLNKCYSLIHMLPERTLTYIGGHAVQFGEEQALQAVKGGIEGASAQMAKSGKAAGYYAAKQRKDHKGKEQDSTGATEDEP